MNKKIKLETLRHSSSHVLALAVLEMFPEAKFAIGPATKDGFYYDFELPRTLIPEDLPLLEEKMKNIIKKNLSFEKAIISIDEAKKKFEELEQKYKVELIEELEEEGHEVVSIYKMGRFVDLCSGPHLDSTGEIKWNAFKLTKVSGAYWKGDEKNEQLQRIYGVVFETKDELKKYLQQQEEAEKRDHRKLGKELDLFTFSELVGPGLPLFTPKGTILRNELQKALQEISKKYKVQPVTIPHIAKKELYEKSGHASKFEAELIKVISHYDEFVMKPVNCPHHTQIYASKQRSYRDLPLRYMESTMQYRDEKPGEIGGLTRVRAITVDDGHTFCTLEQVKEESKNICKIIEEFYTGLGLYGKHWVSLSLRDNENKDAYIGDDDDWKKAEKMLEEISSELGLNAKKMEGEAALYGPKIDFMFKDSLGREWQLATVQLDFAIPKRFELTYIDKDGQKKNPLIIHRAILGSYERFLAILIEHFAGAFPLWLSPVQVSIIPVSEKFDDYAREIEEKLLEKDIRVEMSLESETLGKRISEAEQQKIPYMIIVGEKEQEAKTVNIRKRGEKEQLSVSVDEFVEKMIKEIREKTS